MTLTPSFTVGNFESKLDASFQFDGAGCKIMRNSKLLATGKIHEKLYLYMLTIIPDVEYINSEVKILLPLPYHYLFPIFKQFDWLRSQIRHIWLAET